MTTLGNCTFKSIVREMKIGMNEYNELVYTAVKVVSELCSPKRKRKVNARMKPPWKQKIEKEIEHLRGELRIYEKHGKFYCQMLIFKNDAKKFCREIRKEKVTVNEMPVINDIERFLDTIWCEEKDFNEKAD